MLQPWYWQHLNHQVYARVPHRLAVRVYFAPGRAPEAMELLRPRGVAGTATAHNYLTLDAPRSVYTYLMRSAPSLLLEQALEEYLSACEVKVRGQRVEPEEHERQERAVRGVLACCPGAALARGWPRKRKPKRKVML